MLSGKCKILVGSIKTLIEINRNLLLRRRKASTRGGGVQLSRNVDGADGWSGRWILDGE